MCDCINKLSQTIKNELEQNENVSRVDSVHIPQAIGQEGKAFLTTHVSYTKFLGNGKFNSVKSTKHIMAAFCPFCGKSYEGIHSKDGRDKLMNRIIDSITDIEDEDQNRNFCLKLQDLLSEELKKHSGYDRSINND